MASRPSHRFRTLLPLVAATAAVAVAAIAPTGVALGAERPSGTPRIVNGLETQSHPTVGALLWKPAPGVYYEVCSGTLVGCGTFLTAAHCVCDGNTFAQCGTPDPADYAVYLQNVGIVDVSSIAVNSSFAFGSRGDVSVVRLASPTTGVRPTKVNTERRPSFGTLGEIVGYGITRGNGGDAGLLRRGEVLTSPCAYVDPAQHVCWQFFSPLAAPGFDSNTCNGDSGGPLFADLGDGERVVGITSGGEATSCLPPDSSFDADVYVNRAFIQSIGGADLASTNCGTMPQVGDAGTTVDTFSVRDLGRDAQACRKASTSTYSTFVLSAIAARRACIDGVSTGRRTGPCPDATALAAIETARAKIDSGTFASKCSDGIVRTIDAGADCAGVTDHGALASCVATAGLGAASRAVDLQYADALAASPIADPGALACQSAVARAGTTLLKALLKADAKCQGQEDTGRVAACPDAKTTAAADKAFARAASQVAKSCTDASVALLAATSAFGDGCSGATDVASLVACEQTGARAIADELHTLIRSQTMHLDLPFEVTAGTSRLRVTLNGLEASTNDLDLFLRRGSPATAEVHDAASAARGMFEGLEVASPAAGTWWVHVDRVSGPVRIPYQLTITRFGS
ncbi:MAG: trypsin-like serine protease [Alphaproteobacteria bacterium]